MPQPCESLGYDDITAQYGDSVVVDENLAQVQAQFDGQGSEYWPPRELEAASEVAPAGDFERNHPVHELAASWIAGRSLEPIVAQPEEEATPDRDHNILDMLRLANHGNEAATESLKANIMTATGEAMFKTDHVFEIDMHLNDRGELQQGTQTMADIQKNAVALRCNRDPILQACTQSEVHNAAAMQEHAINGTLAENYMVAVSLVPDGLPEEKLDHRGEGFFMKTLSYSIQVTKQNEDGTFTTHSGFMAGVEAPLEASFEERMASRHDFAAVGKVYAQLGHEAPQTAPELLAKPLLIPKEMMPNGVADFMRWCDLATDDVKGRSIERDPTEYNGVYARSKERMDSLMEVNEHVLHDLKGQAAAFSHPMDAVKSMWEIIKNYTVVEAVTNRHIDTMVFGDKAMAELNTARSLYDQGRVEEAGRSMSAALKSATVGGCGGGSSESGGSKANQSGSSSGEPNKLICVGCPLCGRKGVDASIRYHGNHKTITCSDCRRSKTYKR